MHNAAESNRVTDNENNLTTFRLSNSTTLTCGESELYYFNFFFFYYHLKQLLQLFEGLGKVKTYSSLIWN